MTDLRARLFHIFGGHHERFECEKCDAELRRRMNQMRWHVIQGMEQGLERELTPDEMADVEAQYVAAGAAPASELPRELRPRCPECGRVVHAAWWDATSTTFWHTFNPMPPWWGGSNDRPCISQQHWRLDELVRW